MGGGPYSHDIRMRPTKKTAKIEAILICTLHQLGFMKGEGVPLPVPGLMDHFRILQICEAPPQETVSSDVPGLDRTEDIVQT